MTDHRELQKRCQRGTSHLNDANNLLAECYAALGALSMENQRITPATSPIADTHPLDAWMRKNAERYQHIKATWHDGDLIDHLAANVLPEDWDAAIDADMGKGG